MIIARGIVKRALVAVISADIRQAARDNGNNGTHTEHASRAGGRRAAVDKMMLLSPRAARAEAPLRKATLVYGDTDVT